MNETRKTALDGASIEGGKGKSKSVVAQDYSPAHLIAAAPNAQGIAGILPHGAENAVSSSEVMRLCGISGIRQLWEAIAEERAAGALILSNTTGGYFLPDDGEKDREEMQHFVKTARSKALALLRATRSARTALRVMNGQKSIEQSEV